MLQVRWIYIIWLKIITKRCCLVYHLWLCIVNRQFPRPPKLHHSLNKEIIYYIGLFLGKGEIDIQTDRGRDRECVWSEQISNLLAEARHTTEYASTELFLLFYIYSSCWFPTFLFFIFLVILNSKQRQSITVKIPRSSG